MARPVAAVAAATRARILENAAWLFAAHGPGDVSIRAIARRAGVSLGMVHHYFGSKDELYASCVDSMYEELRSLVLELRDIVGETDDLRSAIEGATREGYAFARAHASAVRLAMRQVVETGRLDPGRREDVLVPFLDEMSAAVARVTGRRAEDLRLPLQSIVFLVGRYAIADVDELRAIAGGGEGAGIVASVEDHLARVAVGLLGMK
jgi:AcrR family transcriptional regulator